MNIGDTVTSQYIMPLTTGTIVGILKAKFHQAEFLNGRVNPQWDALYPDWLDKTVVFVLFDKLQKPVTFEEFKRAGVDPKADVSEDELKVLYKHVVRPIWAASFPIDDLQVVA